VEEGGWDDGWSADVELGVKWIDAVLGREKPRRDFGMSVDSPIGGRLGGGTEGRRWARPLLGGGSEKRVNLKRGRINWKGGTHSSEQGSKGIAPVSVGVRFRQMYVLFVA
jgi:hypothetical protein